MRTLIFLFILFSAKSYAGDLPIQEVRRLYQASANKEEISIQLISILEKIMNTTIQHWQLIKLALL